MSLYVVVKNDKIPKGLARGTERIISGSNFIWILKSGDLDPSNPENWERIWKADILRIEP